MSEQTEPTLRMLDGPPSSEAAPGTVSGLGMVVQSAPALEAPPVATQGRVFKNALLLLAAQVLATPVSLVVNAVMARYLGAKDFGTLYLAQTFCAFGFLLVEWGQGGMLPAMVARDRAKAGELVGTGIAWRMMASPGVYLLLAGACWMLGYSREFHYALAFVVFANVLWTISVACQDAIRGFERTDVAAYATVGQPILQGVLVVCALLAGGRLLAALGAQALTGAIVAVLVWRALRRVTQSPLSFRRATLKRLLTEGLPFLALGFSMALQPNIDALLLSKLAPVTAIGWHAAATKLVGVLVFPATALIAAFYPTLCRLFAEDRKAFLKSSTGCLRASAALVVPVALGCALYPDLGIRVYSRESFGPAEDNLRVLSLFVFLLYFSMMLGTCIAAAGRQRAWAISQFMCVVVSAVADPILIPWFQAHHGNGGLGVCVSTVISEALMVTAGCFLAPKGILDRSLLRSLALTGLAGVAMAVVAWLLRGVTPFAGAPLAVTAYALCLWVTGGLDPELVSMLRSSVARKFARKAQAAGR